MTVCEPSSSLASMPPRRIAVLGSVLAAVTAGMPGCTAPKTAAVQPAPILAPSSEAVRERPAVFRAASPVVQANHARAAPADWQTDRQPLSTPNISSPSDLPPVVVPTPAESDRVTDLDTLIAAALETHPRIVAARQRVAAAAARVPQARALPDPMFSNTFWPMHDHALQTAGGRVGNQMSLSQQVPWPTKLDARAAVAAREIAMARAEVAEVERGIVEAVRLAYYELWLAQQAIEVVADNREIVSDLIAVAEARYRAGGTQQDVLRAELEADRLEEQRIQLVQQAEQARADLGALVRQPISLDPTARTALELADVGLQLRDLVARAEQCNPTLQGLAAEIARDRARETVACLQQYPDLQLGINWGLISDGEDVLSPVANGHDNISFSVGVTLPIWHDKVNAGIREAAFNRSSTVNQREAARDQIAGQIRRLAAAAQAATEQKQLYEERLIPRTERTLRLATADYQGNRTDFSNLVDLYQEVLSYQLQLARIEATLASTLARLDRVVGCPEAL